MDVTVSVVDVEQQVAARIAAGVYGGDAAAETELVSRYCDGLRYVVYRRTRDRELAHDLAQETLAIALKRLREQPLDDPSRLAGYLRGIAVNLLTAERRKSARRATEPDSELVELMPTQMQGPFDLLSSHEVAAAVRSLIAELKVGRDRDVLYRVYLHQEDKEHVCRELGLDNLQLNRILHRARERFKELLMKAERRHRFELLQ